MSVAPAEGAATSAPAGSAPKETPPGAAPADWRSGFCACSQDPASCMCAWCCPCLAFGRVAEYTSDGRTNRCTACSMWCLLQMCTLGCLYSHGFRRRLRHKFGLPEQPCHDLLMHWCCFCCALSQEYRELEARVGSSLSHEFKPKRTGAPPKPQGMKR